MFGIEHMHLLAGAKHMKLADELDGCTQTEFPFPAKPFKAWCVVSENNISHELIALVRTLDEMGELALKAFPGGRIIGIGHR